MKSFYYTAFSLESDITEISWEKKLKNAILLDVEAARVCARQFGASGARAFAQKYFDNLGADQNWGANQKEQK